MSAVPKQKLTAAEYLAIERQAEWKSEFLHGEMFAMAGASYLHTRIHANLIGELGNQLKGTNSFTLSLDMRLKVTQTGLYTYPDTVIVCGRPEFEDEEVNILLNPQIIIEVLSPSSEAYDRGAKFRHYQRIPTFREYILISQDEMVCERLVYQSDDNWLHTTFRGPDSELAFSTISVRIRLADLYSGIAFSEET